MMTNKEKYKRAFSVLETSRDFDMEVIMNHNRKHTSYKKAVTLALAAALVLALCVSAYAAGEDGIRRLLGWDRHIEQSEYTNEVGDTVTHTHYGISEPVCIRDERLFFIANGENTDITDIVTNAEPYTYSYTDAEGYTYFFIVGLSSSELESYGYAEFVKSPDGSWQGGHAHGTCNDAPWLEKGKEEFNLPW